MQLLVPQDPLYGTQQRREAHCPAMPTHCVQQRGGALLLGPAAMTGEARRHWYAALSHGCQIIALTTANPIAQGGLFVFQILGRLVLSD